MAVAERLTIDGPSDTTPITSSLIKSQPPYLLCDPEHINRMIVWFSLKSFKIRLTNDMASIRFSGVEQNHYSWPTKMASEEIVAVMGFKTVFSL